jgi:hypothetical protein
MKQIERKSDQIKRIAARHGAGHVRVFGSVVRGDDRSDSDIDFLVSMEAGRDLFDIIELSSELNSLLDARTDVLSEVEISPYIRDRILTEATAI